MEPNWGDLPTESPGTKRRGPRTNQEQRETFVDFATKHPGILDSMHPQYHRLWATLSKVLNAAGAPQRSPEEWSINFRNWHYNLTSKMKTAQEEAKSGHPPRVKLTRFEERALRVWKELPDIPMIATKSESQEHSMSDDDTTLPPPHPEGEQRDSLADQDPLLTTTLGFSTKSSPRSVSPQVNNDAEDLDCSKDCSDYFDSVLKNQPHNSRTFTNIPPQPYTQREMQFFHLLNSMRQERDFFKNEFLLMRGMMQDAMKLLKEKDEKKLKYSKYSK
ncbi:uncharacterized protein LOC132257283 [Phlebotomus argentipes]|uniref:uncharacterized protein LOC132257283 n=1 Tax=Phlebotomus argentipes TaxID=94469 RepID=UPI002893142B|nr:uncharacterized protein LOC132257283 [Phlebotomus argentipes]XP_059610113.1 uncharacterized protein LOC132257283 [Phlebotomus argentipes]